MSFIQMFNKTAWFIAPLYKRLAKVVFFVFVGLLLPIGQNWINTSNLPPRADLFIEFIASQQSIILHLMLFVLVLTLVASIGNRQRETKALLDENFKLCRVTEKLKLEDLNFQKVDATDSENIELLHQNHYRPYFGTYFPRMASSWSNSIDDGNEIDFQVGEDELEQLVRQGRGFLLLGPPLSGKTCTIFQVLRRMKSYIVVSPRIYKSVPDQKIFDLFLKKRNVVILLDDFANIPSDYDLTLFRERLNKSTAGSYTVVGTCRGGADFVKISTGPSNPAKLLCEKLGKFRLSLMTVKQRIKLAETTGETLDPRDAWRYPLPGRITMRKWITHMQDRYDALDDINKDTLRAMKLLSAGSILPTFDRLLVCHNQVFGYALVEPDLKSILKILWVEYFLLRQPTMEVLGECIDFGILEEAVCFEEGPKPKEARWDNLEKALATAKDVEALMSLSYSYNQSSIGDLDRSLSVLDKVLMIEPDNASGHFHRGYTLAHLKRLSEALEANTRAIQLRGDFAEAYNNRGWIYSLRGEFKEAEAALLHALELQPEYADAHTNLGIVYSRTDRKEEALEEFNAALGLRQSYYAYLSMGITLSRQDSFDEALAAFDKALEDRPNYPKAYLHRGITLARWGNKEKSSDKYKKALEAQKKAIDLDPDYAEVYMYLGQTYALLERYSESRNALTRAIEIEPDYAMAYCNRSRTFVQMREFQLALDDCDNAIELQPEWAEAHLSRGILLARPEFNRLPEAVVALKKATSLDPNNAEAHMNLGIPLARLKRYGEALDAYKQAIRLDNNNTEIYMNLAHTLVKMESRVHLEEAVTVYDQVLKLRESSEAYHRQGILLVRLNKLKEARHALEKAINLDPDNAEAHMNLGITLSRSPRYLGEAVAALEKATSLDPDNAKAHMNLGIALARWELYDKALDAYKQAIRLDNNNTEIYMNLAHTLVKMESRVHLEEAVTVYDQVLKLRESSEAYHRQGILLVRLNKLKEARHALEKAINLDPDNAEAHMSLGITLVRLKSFDEAVAAFKKATELDPNYAEAYLNLGISLARDRKYDEAIEAFDEAIKVKTNYAEAFFNKAHTLCFHKNAPNGMDRFGKSIALLEKAISLSPSIGYKLDRLKHTVFFHLAAHPDYGARFSNLLN